MGSKSKMEATNSVNSDKEYAAQYFGFVPNSFVDDLSEDSIDLVANSLVAMKEQLPGRFVESELDESFKKVELKYQENQEKIFEKLGSFLCAHILKIPGHVLLPEDEAWDGETSAGATSKLLTVNTQMEVMRDGIKSALYKKAVLSAELENIQEVCKSQEVVIEKDKELFKKHGIDDCKDLMDFTIQNKRSLANKSKELEIVMGNLSDKTDDASSGVLDSNMTKRKNESVETNLDSFVKKLKS